MSERLAIDSLMTADGEVVQLPVLGPLGPVDAEGDRIPLDTVRLFDAEGRFLKHLCVGAVEKDRSEK